MIRSGTTVPHDPSSSDQQAHPGVVSFQPRGVGLFVLLLAPEAFLPVRNIGSSYHAATEGIAAAEHAFAILDEDKRRRAGVDTVEATRSAPSADHVLRALAEVPLACYIGVRRHERPAPPPEE